MKQYIQIFGEGIIDGNGYKSWSAFWSRYTWNKDCKNKDEQRRFISDNSNLALLSRDNWMSIRDYRCFARENERMITHGGSHFMEVVIPFAKIE